jgi:uncharacterized membrane protein YfcA
MSAPALGLGLTAMATGMIGRLVGMGGGFLLVPALTLGWGLETHEAISASLAGVLATAVISTVANFRAGRVDLRLAGLIEVMALVGAAGGVYTTSILDGPSLRKVFGACALGFGVLSVLAPPPKVPKEDEIPPPKGPGPYLEVTWNQRTRQVSAPGLVGLGGVAGFLAGLLGIGGGFLKTPGMVFVAGVPPALAAGTALATVAVTSCFAILGHAKLGHFHPALALPLAAGGVLGALIVGRVDRGLSETIRRHLISGALLAAGAAMLLK